MGTLPDKELNKLSLTELGELLQHYNIYAISANMGTTRPSGPELKDYLKRRLAKEDGKPKTPTNKEPQMLLVLDLNVVSLYSEAGNLLLDIEHHLTPSLHNGNKAVRRPPREYAREIVLALMENLLLKQGELTKKLMVLLFEDKYVPSELENVHCRGVDWVVYSPVIQVSTDGGISYTQVTG